MLPYKHTQIGYLMLVVTLFVLALFTWAHITALSEAPSVDSGPNFLVSAIMVFILVILSSFATLTVSIDGNFIRVKFGYGIFRKKISLKDISSIKNVKNHWYYGWGIRMLLRPTIWIFNVSGFDAVEVVMKDGKIYRIGTDEPSKLESAITAEMNRLMG